MGTYAGAKPGSGKNFEKLEEDLKGRVRDPAAVAAAAGRRKYGKKQFEDMAAEGRRRAERG